jgi:hypothetical protein
MLYNVKYLVSWISIPRQELLMDSPLWKRPIAWLPVCMSLLGLLAVLIHAAIYGTAHEADEGATAHIFQILVVAQVPMVGYFCLRWLPRAPGAALRVLALQAAALAAAFASVYFLT